jgi:hypothetical protein
MFCKYSFTQSSPSVLNYRLLIPVVSNSKVERSWKSCLRSYGQAENSFKLRYVCLHNPLHNKINYLNGQIPWYELRGPQKTNLSKNVSSWRLEISTLYIHSLGCFQDSSVISLIIIYTCINPSLGMSHFHINSFVWSTQQLCKVYYVIPKLQMRKPRLRELETHPVFQLHFSYVLS